jgi:uncharacterized protein
MDASLYTTRVMHRRLIAPLYRFVYRVFYVLLDVDRIDAVCGGLRLFSHNRWNLLSLHDRDYDAQGRASVAGAGSAGATGEGATLRAFAETQLRVAGVDLNGGRIRLLTLPRLLGFAFNPLSLWYCEHADGTLRAVIADVRNTFGERHCYVLASAGRPMTYEVACEKEKCFHVSPFFDLVGRYRFLLGEPADKLRVAIHESRDGVPILDATLAGERRALTDGEILRQAAAMPWMTLKVVIGIHWEALKLWLRGAKFRGKPARPLEQTT